MCRAKQQGRESLSDYAAIHTADERRLKARRNRSPLQCNNQEQRKSAGVCRPCNRHCVSTTERSHQQQALPMRQASAHARSPCLDALAFRSARCTRRTNEGCGKPARATRRPQQRGREETAERRTEGRSDADTANELSKQQQATAGRYGKANRVKPFC